jgi:hypothetical protein
MSSSTSQKSKLTNTYFYYGTHPLKVPNHFTHSNSSNNISSTNDQNTQHLSLLVTNDNHNEFSSVSELATTKSLNNISQSRMEDDDNNSEVIFFSLLYLCSHIW